VNDPHSPFLMVITSSSFENGYILDLKSVVDLALLCSFQKMRSHLGVKETDPADKVEAVSEVLRKSTFLKLSEDGVFSRLFFLGG
jgi:hypothetical protein